MRLQVDVRNVIPATYGDYVASTKFNLFEIPPLVDHEMIYYNEAQREFYLFDRKGEWEAFEDDSLSIGKLYNEEKFLNQYFR